MRIAQKQLKQLVFVSLLSLGLEDNVLIIYVKDPKAYSATQCVGRLE